MLILQLTSNFLIHPTRQPSKSLEWTVAIVSTGAFLAVWTLFVGRDAIDPGLYIGLLIAFALYRRMRHQQRVSDRVRAPGFWNEESCS